MGYLSLIDDGGRETTIVPNRFIDEYMGDANDAQLKVYLYLLRMQQAHVCVSVSDIADQFNHTEKDVLRALRFWERRGVLSLEYGKDKSLRAIRLHDLSAQELPGQEAYTQESIARAEAGQTQQTGCALTASATAGDLSAAGPLALGAPSAGDPAMGERTEAAPEKFLKPAYSLDDLEAFRRKSSTAQLVFIAESYLGRTLSPADLKSMLFFSDVLHFSDDLIDYLLQYCVDLGKKEFHYIEKVAIAWAEAGIRTPKEAQERVARYDRIVYSVMNALGKTNAPTRTEVDYIHRWSEEYGFSLEVILEACSRTVLATDNHRFAYADGILARWRKAGVRSTEDIAGQDSAYRTSRPARTGKQNATSDYNRFMQNSYDFEELEKELLRK